MCILVVVNSRIGLWGLWVGVCIGVESKVIVVPWASSCMGFVPEGSSMSSLQIPYSNAGDLCHSAFIVHANCFTIFTRSHSFVHGAFQVPTTMVQVLVVVEFACRCKGLWCGV